MAKTDTRQETREYSKRYRMDGGPGEANVGLTLELQFDIGGNQRRVNFWCLREQSLRHNAREPFLLSRCILWGTSTSDIGQSCLLNVHLPVEQRFAVDASGCQFGAANFARVTRSRSVRELRSSTSLPTTISSGTKV